MPPSDAYQMLVEQIVETEEGLERVIVGTQALKDPAWFRAMAEKYPMRLVLGLDARDGRVATQGWLDVSSP
jgi:phosphoribosylformimino-5-aminoimidazole carboxamide ribotide isomerase